MKKFFDGHFTILPAMSLAPQFAHMDATVVGVFGSPLKSQHCHFGDSQIQESWTAGDGATYEATRRS